MAKTATTSTPTKGARHLKIINMRTEIQKTALYNAFVKALEIQDMRSDDNPFVVKCCEIAEKYAQEGSGGAVRLYTKGEVIQMMDEILQHPDVLTDAINNENTNYFGEELFELGLRGNPHPEFAPPKEDGVK
jgi:hypothetical protein